MAAPAPRLLLLLPTTCLRPSAHLRSHRPRISAPGRFEKCIFFFSIVIFLTLIASPFHFVADAAQHSPKPNRNPRIDNVYLVQLQQPSVIANFGSRAFSSHNNSIRQQARSYASSLVSSHDRFLRHLSLIPAGAFSKLYSLTNVINGIVVHVSKPLQLEILRNARGVIRVQKDVLMKKQTNYNYQFLQLPSKLWKDVGGQTSAGEGIIIGVVDTGVNPTHPSFSDFVSPAFGPIPSSWNGSCVVTKDFPRGSCNKKLIGAQYFAQSAIASNLFDNSHDFASPLDADGHGSHTLSITGGNGNVLVQLNTTAARRNYSAIYGGLATGIAPRARIAMYKSLFINGGTLFDTVAAIEKAVQDRVHILSISICPDSPPPGVSYLGVLDIALLSAVEVGIVVVQAAGNSGPSPGTVASYSPWIITVGASMTDRTFPVTVTLGNNVTTSGTAITGSTLGFLPIIHASNAILSFWSPSPPDCQDPSIFNVSLVRGRILICEYTPFSDFGTDPVLSAATTAQALNAAGFILLTLDASLSPAFFNLIPFDLPGAFMTTYAASKVVIDYYNKATMKLAIASIGIRSGNRVQFGAQAPVVLSFSGRGPSVGNSDLGVSSDVLKPDIVAPGNQIWGAWSRDAMINLSFQDELFAIQTGTSMATPVVAGVAALLRQRHPSWSPAAIQSALVTTASTMDNRKTPLTAQNPFTNPSGAIGPATPFDYGGGHINALAASDPGLVFDATFQDYVNFLCSLPWTTPSQVLNATGGTCRIRRGAKPSDLNTAGITIANLITSRNVSRTVTSVGGTIETYNAQITPPNGVSVKVTPPSFTIQPSKSFTFVTLFAVTKATKQFSFGVIRWRGSAGHIVQMPLSVFPQA